MGGNTPPYMSRLLRKADGSASTLVLNKPFRACATILCPDAFRIVSPIVVGYVQHYYLLL